MASFDGTITEIVPTGQEAVAVRVRIYPKKGTYDIVSPVIRFVPEKTITYKPPPARSLKGFDFEVLYDIPEIYNYYTGLKEPASLHVHAITREVYWVMVFPRRWLIQGEDESLKIILEEMAKELKIEKISSKALTLLEDIQNDLDRDECWKHLELHYTYE